MLTSSERGRAASACGLLVLAFIVAATLALPAQRGVRLPASAEGFGEARQSALGARRRQADQGPRPRSQPQPKQDNELEVVQVRPQFYVIAGAGSNIAVQLGPDGAVVVDTGTAERAEQVMAEIRKLTIRPIRYIINTSADVDHVGGNDILSKAGQSVIPTGGLNEIGAAGGRAPILAEENVQSVMAAPTGEKSAFPIGAWPTVTYSSALDETQRTCISTAKRWW